GGGVRGHRVRPGRPDREGLRHADLVFPGDLRAAAVDLGPVAAVAPAGARRGGNSIATRLRGPLNVRSATRQSWPAGRDGVVLRERGACAGQADDTDPTITGRSHRWAC